MPRYALQLEYHGGPFAGWQRQAGQLSVQEVLETALRRLEAGMAGVVAAGRAITAGQSRVRVRLHHTAARAVICSENDIAA